MIAIAIGFDRSGRRSYPVDIVYMSFGDLAV